MVGSTLSSFLVSACRTFPKESLPTHAAIEKLNLTATSTLILIHQRGGYQTGGEREQKDFQAARWDREVRRTLSTRWRISIPSSPCTTRLCWCHTMSTALTAKSWNWWKSSNEMPNNLGSRIIFTQSHKEKSARWWIKIGQGTPL